MIRVGTRKLEVFICSEMGSPRWTELRSAVRSTIDSLGFNPLDFESFPAGPVELPHGVADLGIQAVKRADIVVALIGETVTDPVGSELETALGRNPVPPIGLFFDKSATRDERAQGLWDRLKDRHVLKVFPNTRELQKDVTQFLVAYAHEAGLNSGAPLWIAEEEIQLEPGEEARRRWLLLPGDTIKATAVAMGPQHHFHFVLADSMKFVAKTRNLPHYDFPLINGDKYSFVEAATASETGFYYVVIRRPKWFHTEAVTVKLSVMLVRAAATYRRST